MANTLLTTKEAGGMHFYIFTTASAGATESVSLPIGKQIVAGFQADIGGTATALTFKYTTATGVGIFSALTAADPYVFVVMTD